VKMENPSMRATVNSKVCKSATVLYLSVIKRTCNQGANKSIRHVYHPTYGNTKHLAVNFLMAKWKRVFLDVCLHYIYIYIEHIYHILDIINTKNLMKIHIVIQFCGGKELYNTVIK
jgi:hypothetical protein